MYPVSKKFGLYSIKGRLLRIDLKIELFTVILTLNFLIQLSTPEILVPEAVPISFLFPCAGKMLKRYPLL